MGDPQSRPGYGGYAIPGQSFGGGGAGPSGGYGGAGGFGAQGFGAPAGGCSEQGAQCFLFLKAYEL